MFPEWNYEDIPDPTFDLEYEIWQRKEDRLDKLQKLIEYYEEENQRD